MNEPDNKSRKALAVQPRQSTYDVGYGKPPADTSFKPGQSGNPKGRPKRREEQGAGPARSA
jgi:hypothetical protein